MNYPLAKEDYIEDEYDGLLGSVEEGRVMCSTKTQKGSGNFILSSKFALILSFFVNIGLLLHTTQRVAIEATNLERSQYAKLERNVRRPWTLFAEHNDTEQDKLWESTSYDLGNIALADIYAKSMGLPRAQRFPWDDTKGIYLINAYHNMHCIKVIRTALIEYRSNTSQSSPWPHIAHCLLVLRNEAMCNADDIPRYTGFQKDHRTGQGQYRMCRDFSELEEWAKKHSACWRHIGEMREPGFRELDRYRFCPEESPYKEKSERLWLEGSTGWWKKYKDQ